MLALPRGRRSSSDRVRGCGLCPAVSNMTSIIQLTEHHKIKEELERLRNHIISSYGPNGKISMLEPIPGGHVTFTRHSSMLFQLYKSSYSIIQMFCLSLQSHANTRDGGKFGAILCCNLILNAFMTPYSRRRVSNIIQYVSRQLMSHLSSSNCNCAFNVDWSSVNQLINIAKTILTSRQSVCELSDSNCNHTSSLLIQAFLHALPTSLDNQQPLSLFDHIHIKTILCLDESPVTLHNGLLINEQHCYNMDELEGIIEDNLQLVPDSEGALITAVFDVSLNVEEDKDCLEPLNIILDPLINEGSSAFRSEKFKSAEFLSKQGKLKLLLELGTVLIEHGVKVVICQKLVHSDLRRYLRKNGILVIERIGSTLIGPLATLSHAHFCSSSHPSCVRSEKFGKLFDINRVNLGNKRYLLLQGPIPCMTLVVFCVSELIAEELKLVLKTIVSGMQTLLYTPRVLSGGGCTETVLANYINHWSNKVSEVILSEVNSDRDTFIGVIKTFHESLLQTAASLHNNSPINQLLLTDSSTHHCWTIPVDNNNHTHLITCCCGTINMAQLDRGTEWGPVKTWLHTETVIPTEAQTLMIQAIASNTNKTPIDFPIVCDIYSDRHASYGIAGDIASVIIKTHATLN